MRIKKFILTLALLWGLLPAAAALVPAAPALAYNPLDMACSADGANASTACNDDTQDDSKITGPNGVIVRVTRIVAAIGGIAAVIMIIVYGVSLITSYGDSGKATSARNGIIAACIGLVVIVLAQAIVVFLISNI
ncbi:MAG TPA: hypothetical protein VD735_03830 [Candidatus Saccharimonadales bacterium]|nr:hypothetical protein [Candidatus Saccharimonadales bacterium]